MEMIRCQLEPPGIPPNSVLSANRLTVGLNRKTVSCDALDFERLVRAEEFREARALYEEQGESERELARQTFEEDVLPELGAHMRDDWRKRGLDSKMGETSFFDWLARKTWGEPTDGDLLAFTLNQSRAA